MNKKRYSAILVISLILVTGIAMAATMPTGNVGNGKNVFDGKCRACHDVTEKENPTLSNLSQLTVDEIKSTVRNGVNGTTMKSFNVSELSNTALDDVVAYIKSSAPVSTLTTANVSTTNVSQPTRVPTEIATGVPTEVATKVPIDITEIPTEVQTPVPTVTPKSPGFEVVIGIIGVLSIYLLRHKNKR